MTERINGYGGVKIDTILMSGPPLADITHINHPYGAPWDIHATCAAHPRRWLGLPDRLHERSAPPKDDQPGSTLPELQYQQVLDNLAQFAANPAALPWHINLREGTSQVTDSLSGGAALDIGPPVTWFPQLLGSRTAVAQWGMSPVIDATELRLLRIAYRRAHGFPDMPSPEFLDELAHELKDQFASNADLRNESELFYEFQGRASRTHRSWKPTWSRRTTIPSAGTQDPCVTAPRWRGTSAGKSR